MFFCGSSVLQLLCHKVQGANAILSVVKNNWNRNFSQTLNKKLRQKQVWQILSNFTKVAGFIPCNIYSWQLSIRNQQSMTNIYPYISVISKSSFRHLLFHLLRQMPVQLVGDAKHMVWSKRPTMLLVQRDISIMLLISLMEFLGVKVPSRLFSKNSRFLDFYRLSDYLYFFKNHPA